MSKVGEKRDCPTCHKFVEVIELTPSEDGWYIQNLSCGHTGRIRIMEPIEEEISITGGVDAKVIKVRTLTEGGFPVVVSGASETSQLASISGFQASINSIGHINHVENVTINYFPETNITSMTTINSIDDIFLQIDGSNYSQEEREKIKAALTKVDNELKSLGGILKIAAPWAQLLGSLLPK